MASRQVLNLTNNDDVQSWLIAFEAKACVDDVEDTAAKNSKAMLFLSKAGVEAVKKLRDINLPKDLIKMTFNDMKASLLSYISPAKRLVLAERTKFFSTVQDDGDTVTQFVGKLRRASEFCDFEQLKQSVSVGDSLVLAQLIVGLKSSETRAKVLQANEVSQMDLQKTIEFLQRLVQICDFCNSSEITIEVVANSFGKGRGSFAKELRVLRKAVAC